MSTSDAWADRIAEVRDDMQEYAVVAAADRERALTAATTATDIAAMADERDTVMLSRYHDRLDETYDTVLAAARNVEKTAALARSSRNYAQGVVERHGIADEQPHDYRPETYDDVLSELDDAVQRILAAATEAGAAVEQVESVQRQLPEP